MDRTTIAQYDSQNMLGSIEVFDKQCTEAWAARETMQLPQEYADIDNIVFVGMGGSALGIDVIRALYASELKVPITIVNDYTLPASVTARTLVFFSSYSGTTEEVVEAYEQLAGRTDKVVIVTTGGTLQEIAERDNIPAYIFNPTYNPSNQPRMAVGYSVVGVLGVFAKLGLLKLTDEDIASVASFLQELHAQWGADVHGEENLAKQVAEDMVGILPIYIASEHLEGSVHVAVNQMNENAKTFAGRYILPEMNHHLIEAFRFPEEVLSRTTFLCFESALYHKRNQKRYEVTKDLAMQNGIQVIGVTLQGTTKLHQAFETILLGAYISFYTAIAQEIDPSPIPNVDFLKDALK